MAKSSTYCTDQQEEEWVTQDKSAAIKTNKATSNLRTFMPNAR